MYYGPQERKKSDFLQVHEGAAKLSESPSALYVLPAELGGGLQSQILFPGPVNDAEVRTGTPPAASLLSPSRGWDRRAGGGWGSGNTGGAWARGEDRRVQLLHAGSLRSRVVAQVRSATEKNSEWSDTGGLLQMRGAKRQVFTSVSLKYTLIGIFE